jgi:hypothetical protein
MRVNGVVALEMEWENKHGPMGRSTKEIGKTTELMVMESSRTLTAMFMKATG